MKAKFRIEQEIDIQTLVVSAGARYWEDATVNGVEDLEGDLIPCREGDYWCPIIDIESGQIVNWEEGVEAYIHYKVCDDGRYTLNDRDGNVVKELDGYVPSIMCPGGEGYGDYIIMTINAGGFIQDWNVDLSDFTEDED